MVVSTKFALITFINCLFQVVNKAWRENKNFIVQAREDFTKQVTIEMKQYLDMLKQNFFEEASIKEKIANMDSLQAFKHLFGLLNNINEEVRKRFSGQEFLGIFYELCMKNFVIIQQNELMRTIFLLVLSLASMKTIESSDLDILKYLGFEHAIESNGAGATRASATKFVGKQQTVAKGKMIFRKPLKVCQHFSCRKQPEKKLLLKVRKRLTLWKALFLSLFQQKRIKSALIWWIF